MAFMMPVVKNDWDIYNSARTRRTSESAEKAGPGGRVRKVSESRSEGPSFSARSAPLSPHRSAPAMRSLSYVRGPASRASLRPVGAGAAPPGSASPGSASARATPREEKFHTRARADSPERRSRCAACVPYL